MDMDILEQAKQYEQSGAAAISVLTDESFFHGSLEDLRLSVKLFPCQFCAKILLLMRFKSMMQKKCRGIHYSVNPRCISA